jgi:phosphate transport system substrate-binding protein
MSQASASHGSAPRTWLLFLAALLVAFACRAWSRSPAADESTPIKLTGAGATLPYPLYSRWIASYQRINPGTQINYQSIGSAGGVRQLLEGTIDFGASDIPAVLAGAQHDARRLVHLPVAIAGVAIAYNLPGVAELRLGPEVLGDLFLGEITRWNDARLVSLNPDVELPDAPVRLIVRSDGSGSTATFTDYAAKTNAAFRDRVGSGPSVTWPSGNAAAGNDGVTSQLKATPGALSYIDLSNALQNGLQIAALRGHGEGFKKPTLAALSAAANAVVMPDELFISLTDAPSVDAYPIAAYTYLLTYADTPDADKGRALAEFAWWATHDGQSACEDLHYARLPAAVVSAVELRIKALKSGTEPLFSGS